MYMYSVLELTSGVRSLRKSPLCVEIRYSNSPYSMDIIPISALCASRIFPHSVLSFICGMTGVLLLTSVAHYSCCVVSSNWKTIANTLRQWLDI